VADGGSTDATRDIVLRIGREHPRVQMIDNPGRIQAAGMNEIIRQAQGDVLVRLDAHGEYPPDYVSACIRALEKSEADNAGGAQRPRAKTGFQRALCAALQSPLGVGGSKYRSEDNEGFVDTVFLGAFRRRVFETVGMYDDGAITNEDAELNQRILEAGGRIYLSRDIVAHYYPRGSFRSLANQYFRYGKGRARTLLKHRTFATPRPAIPFAMVVTGGLLLLSWPVQPFTVPFFLVYGMATGYEALRVGRPLGLRAVPTVWAIFPVLHVTHGTGFAAGLVHYLRHPDWPPTAERVPPRTTAP